MVSNIRTLRNSLGDGVKRPMLDEKETRILQRRSVYANRPIKVGETITRENVSLLRPASGIPAKYLNLVLGRVARTDIEKDQVVDWVNI
jgi:sialic acid synthase SpsE